MKIASIITVLGCLCLAACSKPDPSWAYPRLLEDEHVLTALVVRSGESIQFSPEAKGVIRLGLLVRQAEQLSELKWGGKFVFLRQIATKKYIETYYSATEVFDVSKGQDFLVENQSPISVDVVIYTIR